MEGYTRSRYDEGNFLSDLFGAPDASEAPPDRFEVRRLVCHFVWVCVDTSLQYTWHVLAWR